MTRSFEENQFIIYLMMSNVGKTTLVTLPKTLLNTHREQQSYFNSSNRSHSHVCYIKTSQCIIRKISFTKSRLFQKRYLSMKDDAKQSETVKNGQEESEQDQSFNSESASYRQQTRNSYERKRFNYHHRSQTNGQSQDKSMNYISRDINHYQRLNIDQDADLKTIKSAYYSLSKMYHPDIVGADDQLAAENFRLATESYEVLSDPEKKATYDKELNVTSSRMDLSDFLMRSSSRHPDKDFNLNFRSRNSDMIFRSMQDAALEREKARYPNKFRAGVFVKSCDQESKEELQNLTRRLTHFKPVLGKNYKMDGSEFYKMHLYDTIHRRHQAMMASTKYYKSDESQTHLSDKDAATLMVCIGAATIGIVALIMSFFGSDPGAALDDKLVGYVQKKRAELPETEKSSRYS